MKTHRHIQQSGKYLLSVLLSAFCLSLSAQVNTPQPYASPPSLHDYGKDVSTQKIKKRVISFGFFSPLNSHISFGYDQLLGDDLVFTSQIGIIGPGITNNNISAYSPQPGGAFVEAGVKLFFSPDFVTDGTHRYNKMQGGYFKPQIIVSSFDLTNYNNYSYNLTPNGTRVNYTGAAFMLNFGKQWMFAGSVTLDMYVGVGYSINAQSNSDYISNYYSYLSTGSTLPLAFSAGLNIGVPF
jgi:hypothetical protein